MADAFDRGSLVEQHRHWSNHLLYDVIITGLKHQNTGKIDLYLLCFKILLRFNKKTTAMILIKKYAMEGVGTG